MRSDAVSLRWLATGDLSPAAVQALWPALSAEEKARAERLRFEADRHTFIAAHALLRAMLSAMGGRGADSWTFHQGRFGKPEPIVGEGEQLIRCNLSHAKGMAVVAVAVGRELGVDVEPLDRRAPMEVATRYFTEEEQAYLRALPEARRGEGFFRLWTLKESFMKATGRGMDLPLSSFAFAVEPPSLLYSHAEDGAARWRFHQTRLGAGHIAALAMDCADEAAPDVSVGETTPDEIAAHIGSSGTG